MTDIKTWQQSLEEVVSDQEVVTSYKLQQVMQTEIDDLRARVAELEAEMAALEGQMHVAVYSGPSGWHGLINFVAHTGPLIKEGDKLYLAAGAREAQPMPGAEREDADVVKAAREWSGERIVRDWGDADLLKAIATLDGDWPGCEGCDFECDEPCMPATVSEIHRGIDCQLAQLVHDRKLLAYEGYTAPEGFTPKTSRPPPPKREDSEPVAYRFTHNRGNGNTQFTYHDNEPGTSWKTAYRDTCLEITKLYTRPPKRRAMTRQEIVAICSESYWNSEERTAPDVVAFARAIENFHKIGEPK